MKIKLSLIAAALCLSASAIAATPSESTKPLATDAIGLSKTLKTTDEITIFEETTTFSYIGNMTKGVPDKDGNYKVDLDVSKDWEGVKVVQTPVGCKMIARNILHSTNAGGWLVDFREKPTMKEGSQYVACEKYLAKQSLTDKK